MLARNLQLSASRAPLRACRVCGSQSFGVSGGGEGKPLLASVKADSYEEKKTRGGFQGGGKTCSDVGIGLKARPAYCSSRFLKFTRPALKCCSLYDPTCRHLEVNHSRTWRFHPVFHNFDLRTAGRTEGPKLPLKCAAWPSHLSRKYRLKTIPVQS